MQIYNQLQVSYLILKINRDFFLKLNLGDLFLHMY